MMTSVSNGGGTSNTILLAHKIMAPANYTITNGPNDNGGWAAYVNLEHMRCADSNGNTLHGYTQDAPNVDVNHMGGPHPNGSPVLYADGSVRSYQYLATGGGFSDCATFQLLWAYNRTTPISLSSN